MWLGRGVSVFSRVLNWGLEGSLETLTREIEISAKKRAIAELWAWRYREFMAFRVRV